MFTSRLTNNRTDISVYISVVKEKSFFFLTSIKYKDRSVTTRIGFKDIENDIDTPFFISRSTFSLSLSLWEKLTFSLGLFLPPDRKLERILTKSFVSSEELCCCCCCCFSVFSSFAPRISFASFPNPLGMLPLLSLVVKTFVLGSLE